MDVASVTVLEICSDKLTRFTRPNTGNTKYMYADRFLSNFLVLDKNNTGDGIHYIYYTRIYLQLNIVYKILT